MVAQPSLSARIAEHGQSRTDHRAGTVDTAVLAAIERLAPERVRWSMETGCGKTTILLSNLSEHHHVFAYDDRAHQDSSIEYYESCPLFRPERTTAILGATQLTLPVYPFAEPIDLGAAEEPDRDAAALEPVLEHLGHRHRRERGLAQLEIGRAHV